MKTSMGVTVFSVCLFAAACAAAPPVNPGGPGHLPPPAPTGFDNASNGVTDDATHQVDQGKFDEFEEISDGLGPLYNAQSCRECHQNPVSGRTARCRRSEEPCLNSSHPSISYAVFCLKKKIKK